MFWLRRVRRTGWARAGECFPRWVRFEPHVHAVVLSTKRSGSFMVCISHRRCDRTAPRRPGLTHSPTASLAQECHTPMPLDHPTHIAMPVSTILYASTRVCADSLCAPPPISVSSSSRCNSTLARFHDYASRPGLRRPSPTHPPLRCHPHSSSTPSPSYAVSNIPLQVPRWHSHRSLPTIGLRTQATHAYMLAAHSARDSLPPLPVRVPS